MASIVAGLMSALFSLVGEFDEVSVKVKGDTVTYQFLTSGIPLKIAPEIKTRLWQYASLPAKKLQITEIKAVERGPLFVRYLITAKGKAPQDRPRGRLFRGLRR